MTLLCQAPSLPWARLLLAEQPYRHHYYSSHTQPQPQPQPQWGLQNPPEPTCLHGLLSLCSFQLCLPRGTVPARLCVSNATCRPL
jgi:hypothetical protein